MVRTTIALDDDLVREAQRLSGITEKGALVRQGLRALIERESARRLASLSGRNREIGGDIAHLGRVIRPRIQLRKNRKRHTQRQNHQRYLSHRSSLTMSKLLFSPGQHLMPHPADGGN